VILGIEISQKMTFLTGELFSRESQLFPCSSEFAIRGLTHMSKCMNPISSLIREDQIAACCARSEKL
jgi:hypothetical protein